MLRAPRREFLYSEDMANACVYLINLPDVQFQLLLVAVCGWCTPGNTGVGNDLAIAELARVVANSVGFKGELTFDTSKPGGTSRKLLEFHS